MTTPIRESVPSASYSAMGWKSHEANRILRQARNMQTGGFPSDDILGYIFQQFDKLDDEVRDIYARWDQIAVYVAAKDDEGYVAWSIQRELDRQAQLGVKVPKASANHIADAHERFKRWLLP